MKSKFKFFLFALVLGLFVTNSAIGQSNPSATVSSDNGITLSQTNPLGETYDIDISDKGWTLEEAQSAVIYFEEKSNLIDLELDYANQKFILTLDLDAPEASTWNIQKWNEPLVSVR